MLPTAVLSSALRATGLVKPSIAAYLLTVVINALLAPVLVAGWGTGVALGVLGAGLATSVSIAAGVIFLGVYFHRLQRTMAVKPKSMRPNFERCRGILRIGLPASSELVLSSFSIGLIYHAIREFGSDAQAGFGIGSRVLQALLLPGMAIAGAVSPIVGQNFGAGNGERVRETFYKASSLTAALMLVTTILIQWWPELLLGLFQGGAASIEVAMSFLKVMSWTLVAQGFVFTCTTSFQGLGNTLPSLISATTRFAALAIPVLWLSKRLESPIEHLWYFASASVLLQALVSASLLHWEFNRKLERTDRHSTAHIHSNA
jgi:putative MATE family efflux protein